jgi:hypothetical protein
VTLRRKDDGLGAFRGLLNVLIIYAMIATVGWFAWILYGYFWVSS